VTHADRFDAAGDKFWEARKYGGDETEMRKRKHDTQPGLEDGRTDRRMCSQTDKYKCDDRKALADLTSHVICRLYQFPETLLTTVCLHSIQIYQTK
jgi:hypothetical protein